ncbi:MAG TPA: zinc ribbon domain-containing protein, partial [Fimbriimonas sp.]|nr:zinc ribbon domain-containing protein [Fimbriimonas sp.]
YTHLMPVYEFLCQQCNKRFSDLVSVGAPSPVCPVCSAPNTQKLVSKFVRGRSEEARLDDAADRIELMDAPESASATRQMFRELGKAVDDDASDQLEEMFETDMEGGDSDEL